MTSNLKTYLPAILFFQAFILFLTINSSSVSPHNSTSYAYDEIEAMCRENVKDTTAIQKGQADRYRDIQLAGVGLGAGIAIPAATVAAGPPGFYVSTGASGVAALAILGAHNRKILELEAAERAQLEQCAIDAQYLRNEADAAEQGEEGRQSTISVPILGIGFGTNEPKGITGGEFLF